MDKILIYLIKLAGTLVQPIFLFILILFITAMFLRAKNKGQGNFLIIITILFSIVSMPLTSELLLNNLEKKYSPPKKLTGDCIIMLGGGSTYDSPDIDGSGHLSGFAANRLIETFKVYKRTNLPIIVSGGKLFAFNGNESKTARTNLISMGADPDMIFTEDNSRNTIENAKYCKKIMDNLGFKDPILVTSAFHMNRSMLIFKKIGIMPLACPCDYMTNTKIYFDPIMLLPNAASLFYSSIAIKEYYTTAVMKYKK